MITFHNDHLVTPEFCKLIYNTVPEEHHIPVIFVPHPKDYRVRGRCCYKFIKLNLQGIYYYGYPGEFRLWKSLLYVAYHEFGHRATAHLTDHISNEEYYTYGRGYQYMERLAEDWANQKLLELAEEDKRLYQPKRLGPYFDGRIVKTKNRARASGGLCLWVIEEYRRYITGGQLSAREVASSLEAYRYPKSPNGEGRYPTSNSRHIKKLAMDLAYIYTDRLNRKHQYFAWGDIPEIGRRVAKYKAIHGPTSGETEYNEELKRIQSLTVSDSESIDFFEDWFPNSYQS